MLDLSFFEFRAFAIAERPAATKIGSHALWPFDERWLVECRDGLLELFGARSETDFVGSTDADFVGSAKRTCFFGCGGGWYVCITVLRGMVAICDARNPKARTL